jgi:hypothetical protein
VTTSYTLDNPVANANELALFINFVRQEPTTAYSASGTSLTLTSATSATDDMYCVFLGKAVQTVNPPNASVGLSQLTATGTKDATTFLRGDNTFASAGVDNTPLFYAYKSSGTHAFTLNTNTKVTLDTESYDSGSFFDITTNYRFLPTIAGKYLFIGQVNIDYTSGVPTTLNASIRLNNTSTIATSGYNAGSGYGSRNMSGIVNMNGSTDYIELFVYSNSTIPTYIGGQYNTWLTGFKIIE